MTTNVTKFPRRVNRLATENVHPVTRRLATVLMDAVKEGLIKDAHDMSAILDDLMAVGLRHGYLDPQTMQPVAPLWPSEGAD